MNQASENLNIKKIKNIKNHLQDKYNELYKKSRNSITPYAQLKQIEGELTSLKYVIDIIDSSFFRNDAKNNK